MVKEDLCEKCRFFDANFGGLTGECRKNSPILHNGETRWPMVAMNEWCGDFETKK